MRLTSFITSQLLLTLVQQACCEYSQNLGIKLFSLIKSEQERILLVYSVLLARRSQFNRTSAVYHEEGVSLSEHFKKKRAYNKIMTYS